MGKKEVVLGGQAVKNVNTGSESIGVTAEELSPDNRPLEWGVQVVADEANTGNVYVGVRPNLTAGTNNRTDGFKLTAGAGVFIPVPKESELYLIASAGGQAVTYLSY